MSTIEAVAGILRAGGIVAYPTEGVWGLGCDPNRGDAVKRVLKLKRRPSAKGMILLGGTIEQLQPWIGSLPEERFAEMKRTWPGPVTWVVPASTTCPDWVTGGKPTVAVRCTAHAPARDLAIASRTAIISTSANVSGASPARSLHDVTKAFAGQVDAILDGETGGLAGPTEIRNGLTGQIIRPRAAQQ